MTALTLRMQRFVRRNVGAVLHPSFLPILRHVAGRPRGAPAPAAPPLGLPAAPISDAQRFGAVAPSATIPKRIFQTWKSRSVVPSNYAGWRGSFITLNPGYDVTLWDDDDNRAFITARFPWFLATYERYPREIFRADAVRPLFLFLFGGFYADMDSECLLPLDSLLAKGDVLLGRMGYDRAFEHSIPNAIMASRPFQAFWLLYAVMMMERAAAASPEEMNSAGPETFTGPIILRDAVLAYARDPQAALQRCAAVIAQLPAEWRPLIETGAVELLAPGAWYGIDWTNPMHRRLRARILETKSPLAPADARALFPGATMVTYWSHSW